MKKIIPYIVILLITYLVTGFIHMQLNTQYWTVDNRVGMVCFNICVMLLYILWKFMIKEIKK
jgi:hypothetical protein